MAKGRVHHLQRRAGSVLLALLAGALVHVGAAGASPVASLHFATVSSNWAGYAVIPNAKTSSFKSVSARWVQPTVTCSGRSTYSGFWVGLGGYSASSHALEQIGTEADCAASGGAVDYAWYELVPKAPVKLKLKLHPGDVVAASVTVSGKEVKLTLRDETTRTTYATTQRASAIDVSSAEWIAEAPSDCGGYCHVLPLADFGSVAFSDAAVTSSTGRKGSIRASLWTPETLELLNLRGAGGFGPFGNAAAVAGAVPSALSANGAAFTVSWQQITPPSGEQAPPAPVIT